MSDTCIQTIYGHETLTSSFSVEIQNSQSIFCIHSSNKKCSFDTVCSYCNEEHVFLLKTHFVDTFFS